MQLGVGDMVKISYHDFIYIFSNITIHNIITILCHLFFEQYSQTNFPIVKKKKKKAFQGNKYKKKNSGHLGQIRRR